MTFEHSKQRYAGLLKTLPPFECTNDHIQASWRLARLLAEEERYLQAATLYHYGLNLSQDNEQINSVKKELNDLERKFLITIYANNYIDIELDVKSRLELIRAEAKNALDANCSVIPTKFSDISLSTQSNSVLSALNPNIIANLYSYLSQEIKNLIRDIIEECHQQLDGPPNNCIFSIIAFGSLARTEMTPYSDLEFGILINQESEEIKEYFRRFTRLFHYKIISIGETIVPAMAIPELNDFYNQHPSAYSFFDYITKRGFSLDGLMPTACKYPLGRAQTSRGKAFELLQTPHEMAKLRIDSEYEPALHMSSVLADCTLLSGSGSLLHEYKEIIRKQIDCNRTTGISLLQNSLIEFDPALFEQSNEGKLYNVKKDLYRLPSLLLEGLRLYYSIEADSNFELIEKLVTDKHLNKKFANHLKQLLAIGLEIRLKNYLTNGQQDDNLSIIEQHDKDAFSLNHIIKPIAFSADIDTLIKFYHCLLSLQEIIANFLAAPNDEQSRIILSQASLLKNKEKIKGLVYKRIYKPKQAFDIFAKIKEKDSEIKNYQFILAMQLNDFEQASSIGDEILANQEVQAPLFKVKVKLNYALLHLLKKQYPKALEKLKMVSIELKSLKESHLGKPWLKLRLNYLLTMGEYERQCFNLTFAEDYFKQALEEAEQGNLAEDDIYYSDVWNSLGLIYTALADYNKAEKYLVDSFKLAQKHYGFSMHYRLYPPLFNLGNLAVIQADYQKAKKHLLSAEHILNQSAIADKNHKLTSYCDIAMLFDALGEQKKAQDYLNIAYSMDHRHIGVLNNLVLLASKYKTNDKKYYGQLKAIIENDERMMQLNAAEKSSIYNTLAMIDDNNAIGYLKDAHDLLIGVYGNKPHPDIAKLLDNIGIEYLFKAKKLSSREQPAINYNQHKIQQRQAIAQQDIQQANDYITKALDIREKLYSGHNHPDLANSYMHKSNILMASGNIINSKSVIEKALSIYKIYPGHQINVLKCKILLGICYSKFLIDRFSLVNDSRRKNLYITFSEKLHKIMNKLEAIGLSPRLKRQIKYNFNFVYCTYRNYEHRPIVSKYSIFKVSLDNISNKPYNSNKFDGKVFTCIFRVLGN